jgi:hypothetical protein
MYESVKYPFSKDEIRELGESLAREAQTVFDLKEKKKNTVAGFAAMINAANERVAELTTKINNGYELREIECLWLMETPRPGMKRLIRTDSQEHVRDEPMTQAEMQGSFGFDPGEDRRPEK